MKKFFLLISSLVFTLILCEIILRLAIPYSPQLRILTGDKFSRTEEGFERVEDLVSSINCHPLPGKLFNGFYTNSKGFLNREIAYDNPYNHYRIVALGDSFGMAPVPYEYNYLHLLEDNLRRVWKENLEVINLSVQCIGPKIYKDIYFLEGFKYKPHLLLVGLYVGNDFTDDSALLGSNPAIKSHQETYFQTKKRKVESSKLITLITLLQKDIAFKKATNFRLEPYSNQILGQYTGENTENYRPDAPSMAEGDYNQIIDYKMIDLFPESSPIYSSENLYFEEAMGQIGEIQNHTDKENIQVLVIIIPDELQLNDQLWSDAIQRNSLMEEDLNRYLPQQKAREYFDNHGIQYLDLLPELQKIEDPEKLYQPRDTHFNSDGQIEVSKIVGQHIEEHFD